MAVKAYKNDIVDFSVGTRTAIAEIALLYEDGEGGANIGWEFYILTVSVGQNEDDINGNLVVESMYTDGSDRVIVNTTTPDVDSVSAPGGNWQKLDVNQNAFVAAAAPVDGATMAAGNVTEVPDGKALAYVVAYWGAL